MLASQGVLKIKGTSECAGSGPGTSLSAISRHSLFPFLISREPANAQKEMLSVKWELISQPETLRPSGAELGEGHRLTNVTWTPVLHLLTVSQNLVAAISVYAGAEPSADPCV